MKSSPGIAFILVFLTGIFFWNSGRAASSDRVPIVSSGKTVVSVESPDGVALVTIETTMLEGECADASPAGRVWTRYGVKQVTVVRAINISVGKRKLDVPLMSYAGLFQPGGASLRFEKGAFVLKIDGADGAEAYFSLIHFSVQGVTAMELYSTEFPDQPTVVTKFHTIDVE